MSSTNTTNIWLLAEVVARRRRLIVTFVLVLTLAALVVSLLLPKYFEAVSLVMPPKDTSMPIASLSRLAEVVSVSQGLDLPVMVTSSDVYARMLRSRRVADVIIDSFDLVTHYHSDNRDEAYEDLLDNASFTVTDEGLVRVAMEDRSAQFAADVVNAFVEQLEKLNREIAGTRARQNREFIEERLKQVKAELDSARIAFEQFQMTHRAVDFDEQTRLAIEQAVQLKVRLAEVDIQVKMLAEKMGPDNAELQEWQRQRDLIARELSALERENRDSSFFSLPIAAIPALRGEYEELYSRVRVDEALYQTLLTHLEQAKIQENEDLPTITVLDRATPPLVKSWPKRSVIVGITFFAALVVALLIASAAEYLNRLGQARPEDYQRARLFGQAFFGWLPGMRKQTK